MFSVEVITPPASAPVQLAELKAHARVTGSAEDAVLQAMLDGAVSHLDGYAGRLGRAMISQTWRQDFDGWSEKLRLPADDARDVAVAYIDKDGAEQTVAAGDYDVVRSGGASEVRFRSAFSGPGLEDQAAPVSVTFTTGYQDSAAVPAAIKVAIMMLAAHWYEQREASSEAMVYSVPFGLEDLIRPYRKAFL